MISTNLRYRPANLAEIITNLPRDLRGPAVEAASVYLVGDGNHGLKHYPIYQHISRRTAYGQTFKSPQQRRKVMAMIRNGEILPGYPRRTGNTQRGWYITGSGVTSRIRNDTLGAFYTADDIGQARLNQLGGWRKVGLIIATNTNGMIQAADRRIIQEIRSKGL